VPTIEDLVSPPPSGAFPFIFSDEAGVVYRSATEPFFGIGILKLSDAGRWNYGLNRILDHAVSHLAVAGQTTGRNFEFKFNLIKTTTLALYEELVDYYVAQTDGQFCAFIVDKRQPGVDPIAACGSAWDALIKYAITLMKRYVGPGEHAIVVSDNYQKPKKSPHYFERDIVVGLGNRAGNALMIESKSSMLLQLVDVLLGCVMYHYKMATLPANHAGKRSLADRLARSYGRTTLVGPWTKDQPNYFSVWPFRPQQVVQAHP